jgi:hypothetical protein
MTQAMSVSNCAPLTSSPSAATMTQSCTSSRALAAPVFLKHKISFSVDSLLSTSTSSNTVNGTKLSNSKNTSLKDSDVDSKLQTRQFVESENEVLNLNNKLLLKSDQSTLTQPLSPETGSCSSQVDTDPVDVSTNGDSTRQCDEECNEDLDDEELDVDCEENDARSRKPAYDNQQQYFDSRMNDDSSGTRTSSPSAVRDTEDVSPPVIPKPLHHPGVTLGGPHQPAGATGPPCWTFPPGFASQFAWMPAYRSASPASEYSQRNVRTLTTK